MIEVSEKNAAPLQLRSKSQTSPGYWRLAWRRLRANRAAMIGGVFILLLALSALSADVIAIKPYDKQSLRDNNAIPGWLPSLFPSVKPKTEGGYARVNDAFPLGADYAGRDIFSRLVYGARISLAVAVIGPLISLLIGVAVGCIAGYFGGWVDNLLMRIVDLMYAFPSLLLIILIMSVFRSAVNADNVSPLVLSIAKLDAAFGGLLFIFIGLGITSWENMARLTRGQVLSARERDYVLSAQAIGADNRRILIRHILPNILGPLIVAETLAIPAYILTETFLSYIGLGVNKPTPSWGAMIADGVQGISTYPNQVFFPALILALTMFAFNFLGDGIRDALDPRSSRR